MNFAACAFAWTKLGVPNAPHYIPFTEEGDSHLFNSPECQNQPCVSPFSLLVLIKASHRSLTVLPVEAILCNFCPLHT